MRNARKASRWAQQQIQARHADLFTDGIPAENLYLGRSVRLTVDLVPDGDTVIISHHYRSRLGELQHNPVLALTRDQAMTLMDRINTLLNPPEVPIV